MLGANSRLCVGIITWLGVESLGHVPVPHCCSVVFPWSISLGYRSSVRCIISVRVGRVVELAQVMDLASALGVTERVTLVFRLSPASFPSPPAPQPPTPRALLAHLSSLLLEANT